MYNENEFITPRDRINDELSKKVSSESLGFERQESRINCKGEEVPARVPTPTTNQRGTWGLENYPLASVYSPIQHWRNLYDPDKALERGTLFGELDLPFVCGEIDIGGGCCGK